MSLHGLIYAASARASTAALSATSTHRFVEIVFMTQFETFLLQTAGRDIGQTVDTAAMRQASGPLEHRVQAGNVPASSTCR